MVGSSSMALSTASWASVPKGLSRRPPAYGRHGICAPLRPLVAPIDQAPGMGGTLNGNAGLDDDAPGFQAHALARVHGRHVIAIPTKRKSSGRRQHSRRRPWRADLDPDRHTTSTTN